MVVIVHRWILNFLIIPREIRGLIFVVQVRGLAISQAMKFWPVVIQNSVLYTYIIVYVYWA